MASSRLVELFLLWNLCGWIILILHANFTEGLADDSDWLRRISGNVAPYRTIFVDPSGRLGNFTTIQSAIDSVPSNNSNWVCIYIKKGIYREKVKIPEDKPYIILKGQAKKTTEVVWDDHENIVQSPTFTSLANNIIAKSISFRNSYNNPVNKKIPRVPAVAARVSGDKNVFHRCGFYGLQDTLWDDQGRHYFKRCTVQGAVDFIFGGGQSIYENCAISVLGGALGTGVTGFITAQGRSNPDDASGFVFKECNVFGSGSALLGRAWRAYARVVFYHSNFTDVVNPRGWDAWNFAGQESQLSFSEYGCYGPGSDTSLRVSWEKKLNAATINQLTGTSFVDSEGWLSSQPF
ncbi:probable pectinesterase 55 [Syzygium oleosum]|uniref:probable pectinesterase 55 n=1 Tax=Syzygium oleosum TaxID=219896 RepID=UPI0011D22833|nr:probable pectinesterase 55 [Syzygium oleosum]